MQVEQLELETAHVVRLLGNDGEGEEEELLTVTFLDAGHCPGSVAILFEGACGRVFHTGDFRREDWCGRGAMLRYDDLRRPPPAGGAVHDALEDADDDGDDEADSRRRERAASLPSCLTRAPLDVLLLDNTYANPVYAFPTRRHAAAEIVRLITEEYPEHDVFLGVDSLGKEPLLAAVAAAMGTPVRVTPERWTAAAAARDVAETCEASTPVGRESARYDVAPLWALTASCTATSRVFAVPKQQVTPAKLAKIAASNGRPVVGILPTGWAAAADGGGEPANAFARRAAAASAARRTISHASDDLQTCPTLCPTQPTDGEAPVVRAVPYSLHAPYDELKAMVAALRPAAVLGNTRLQRAAGAPDIDCAARFAHLVWLGDGGGNGNARDGGDFSKGRKRSGRPGGPTSVRPSVERALRGGGGHAIVDVFGGGGGGGRTRGAQGDAVESGAQPGGMTLARSVPGFGRTAGAPRAGAKGDESGEGERRGRGGAPSDESESSDAERDELAARYSDAVLFMASSGRFGGKKGAWARLGRAAAVVREAAAGGDTARVNEVDGRAASERIFAPLAKRRRHVPGWLADRSQGERFDGANGSTRNGCVGHEGCPSPPRAAAAAGADR